MIREFRDYLVRGNVIGLAIAVVIGAAFTAVVNSLVKDIITPVLSLLGIPDFSSWTIVITGLGGSSATFGVGSFLNTVISALIVSATIFLVVVKPMEAMAKRTQAGVATEPAVSTEVELLTEIRDAIRARQG